MVPEQKLHVLLVGNYEKDQQESMQRFVAVLLQHLPSLKIKTDLIQPRARLGHKFKSNTSLGKWAGYVDKYFLFPNDLQKKIRSINSTSLVVHVCDHSNAIYTRYLQKNSHLVNCHDLLAIRSAKGEIPENPTRWTGRQLQRFILNGLNRAQHVVCISEATREDLLRLTFLSPAQTDMIPMGLNYDYCPMEKNKARETLQKISKLSGLDSSPFLFHVGGNQWYKNRLGVLRIYEILCKNSPEVPRLVMAGKSFTPEMSQFVEEKKLEAKVFAVENCSNEELRALYSSAELLLFPSLQEGFGWPIIEAQACGCRVLTTKKSPMTEVGGEAAFYFGSGQYPEAAQQIWKILNQSPEEKKASIESGLKNAARFSTSQMVEQYVALYQKVCAQKTL